ncbi:hypothetical protein V5O48_017770 [Marasmius crinis-equi]|uniref:Uncharacterized protein n=1 Tax=Marasmius crinis-equi TaxID=585013 RepID=A0ABR3EN16_9AGAR
MYNLYEVNERFGSRSSSPGYEEEGGGKRTRLNNIPGPPLECPSDYLRFRCPLCFGGKFPDENYDLEFDAIVCVDACFTQKHNKGGGRDPHKQHPDMVFMKEEEVEKIEDHVDSVQPPTSWARDQKANKKGEEKGDGYDGSMKVPHSALDGCEASFTAADDRREKASTQFLDCTALMALLCRHDRVLWIANMKSVGEKQHYVFALVNKLFEHVPPGHRVGLLYDIGCQLHGSCMKWDFLRDYWDRLGFTISVFHAFGHNWPCQLIYHPRKRTGFGLSDGEGCERFWHSISRLIPYIWVCGSARSRSLILRKRSDAHGAEWVGKNNIGESGYSANFLREQWELQKAVQTKPLPKKSNQQGKQAVKEVMRLRSSVEMLQSKKEELEPIMLDLDADLCDYVEATENLPSAKQRFDEMRRKLQQKEQVLGVEAQQETCLMAHLRARKLQRDRLECLFRKQVNGEWYWSSYQYVDLILGAEQKIHAQITQSSKRKNPSIQKLARDYNKLVSKMEKMIADGHVPQNAVALRPIPMDQLFALDVDDDIWQDVGLTDEWDQGAPPLWLANEGVRAGIRAVLHFDCGQEEITRLAHERDAMQCWSLEEWDVLIIGSIVPSGDVPAWGPSAEELAQMRMDMEGELVDKEGREEEQRGEWIGGQGSRGGLSFVEEEEGINYDETDFNTLEP